MMRRLCIVGFGLVALCVLTVACSQAGASEATATVGQPDVSPATPPSASPTEFREPGAVLVSQRCTKCHSMAIIANKKYTEEQWRQNVNEMVALGTQLTPAEQDQVLQYLTATYHP